MPLRHSAARQLKPSRFHQQRDDALRRIADTARPLIGKAFAGAISQFRRSIDVKALADAIKHANKAAALEIANPDRLGDALKHAFASIEASYRKAADLGSKSIHDTIRQARAVSKTLRKDSLGDDVYAFDGLTDAVQSQIREYQDALIQQMTTDVRDLIEEEMQEGTHAGAAPEAIASRIRGSIGLTDVQSGYIDNYRRALSNLDTGALTRELTNDDADEEVKQAISAGSPLSQDRIDALVQAYSDNWIAYRAQTIADTESVRSANLGLHASYQQAVDRNVFPDEAVKRFWKLALDERVCDVCQGIADANDEGVGVDEAFVDDDGNPVDNPPMHVRCRCSVEYVTDLSMVNADAGAGSVASADNSDDGE